MGLDDLVNKAKDLAGDVAEKAKDIAGDVTDKAKDIAGDVTEKAKDVAGTVAEEAGELKDIATGEGTISDKAKAAVESLKDPGKPEA